MIELNNLPKYEDILCESKSIKNYKGSIIYFLIKGLDIIYVGKSKVGISRIFSHINKDFDEVNYIKIPEEYLDAVELFYIQKFKPALNVQKGNTVKYEMIKDIGFKRDK